MLGNGHAGFGKRPGETHRWRHRQGAPDRPHRGERLIHTQALLALARRLVDVLWALLRDGREFTPDRPLPATAAA